MKKILRFAFFMTISLTGLVASAQDSKTASTTLNVKLGAVYNMTVGAATVEIGMASAADFQNGKESTAQVLTVNASNGYDVTVQTSGANLLFGSETIPVSTIDIKTSITGVAPTDATLKSTPLSSTANTIISKTTGEITRAYNIVYAISAANASAYLNKTAGTYTTTVTYSLVAK